jgi:hypothetical protein
VIMHLEILQTKQKYPFLTDSIKKNQLPWAEWGFTFKKYKHKSPSFTQYIQL